MRTSLISGLVGTAFILSASVCTSVCAQGDMPAPTRVVGQVDRHAIHGTQVDGGAIRGMG